MLALLSLTCVLLLASDTTIDPAELEWRKPEGGDLFTQAQKAFDEESYKESYDLFKKLKKLAKNKKAKITVALYRKGAEGGYKLAGFKERIEKSPKHKIYLEAEKAFSSDYRDTPVAAAYEEFLKKLAGELFNRIENFESKGKRYSEKFGKTFIEEPKLVKEGRRSLRWETKGKHNVLKIKGKQVPDRLTGFRAVSFWMYFDGRGAPFEAMFICKGDSKRTVSQETLKNGYFKALKAHKGWKRIEIPLKEFAQQGKADWGKVEDFRIQFNEGAKVTVYLDDISLIKQ